MGIGPDEIPIIDRIKAILRRDLKLGEDAAIGDDMILAGGEYELDSLDLLLLMTSIEREFGIRIVDGSITREAFATVATLSAFVEKARAAHGS